MTRGAAVRWMVVLALFSVEGCRDRAKPNATPAASRTPAPVASAVSVSSPSSAGPPDCKTFPPLPASASWGGTTVHFAQSGCSVAISAIDLASKGTPLRTVSFDPPLPAGSVDVKAPLAPWSAKGAFKGGTKAGSLTLDETGTYQASGRIVIAQAVGGSLGQFATSAVASSSREGYNYSALQATSAPNNLKYGEKLTAWCPKTKDGGAEWLELTYPDAMVPARVKIWENFGSGSVRRVEAFDDAAKAWTVLWEGTDPTPPGRVAAFSPPLKPSKPTRKLRVTIDTAVPEWNEVDAVEMIGPERPAGWVIWATGGWIEEGTVKRCIGDTCDTRPWSGQAQRRWSWAFDTATGKATETPEEVE